ncbi:hypothetical protein [Anaeromyxobacter terrae]|uniref:hypothetical protein n=1 Tax=Anaeromyxobacter terrae TaxID=2925406 RepID=UPI001F59CB07|nr:hypothetical protein [Anaeromyxobacter sp. SG22]
MSLRAHARLFLVAALIWLAFWVAGLPDYYQQYSTRSLVVFEVLLLGPVWTVGYLALRDHRRVSRMRRAVAISFHFTIPLFVYDLAYCGLYRGLGLGFVVPYWYLTAYYFVPWVLFLPTAAWLDRRAAAVGWPNRA